MAGAAAGREVKERQLVRAVAGNETCAEITVKRLVENTAEAIAANYSLSVEAPRIDLCMLDPAS